MSDEARSKALKGFVLLLALGGITTLAVFLAWPQPEARAALPVEVYVAGQPVQVHGDSEALARKVAAAYLSRPLTLEVDGEQIALHHAELGTKVDVDHLAALLAAAADGNSPLRRVHGQVRGQGPLLLPIPAHIDTELTLQRLSPLKDLVDRRAVSAHVDPRKGEVVQARDGVQLDLHGTLERLDRALPEGATTVEARVLTTDARTRAAALGDVSMDDVLGYFETRHSRGERARSRSHNLKVAASKIDGHILAPGEEFDFNDVVGPRNRSNGFEMAPVISYGKLVDGMGGGTCQIASTLHAAVYFAGLRILERHPHSRPSFYIKLGLDAAVADGSLNFRFVNDSAEPVVIEMTVEGGRVRAALHGKKRERTVTFLRRIDKAIPFEEQVVEDETLPSGLRVLTQRGVPGFELSHWRVVHDERTGVARRERGNDTYPPTTQVWRVGTGGPPDADFVPPKSDAHPEYVADEFLRATQGPHTDGIEVEREAGRTGTYGWTEREGMLQETDG